MFKADIHKAFDTLDWTFIIKVMAGLGFPQNWQWWIRNLVLQGSSQILVNGLLGKKLFLKRGVRQGDPLSPLLFILAMDFLPRWQKKLSSMGAIRMPVQGMHPCLFYADDALFFIKPEIQQVQLLKIVLITFASLSGLNVNMEKSELLIQGPEQLIQQLLAIMGCRRGHFPFTYLGLPLSTSRLPKAAYLPLIQRINARLSGWTAKFLNMAGRIVLINAVLTSIPVYYMSVFKLPSWVIIEIDKIRKRFLWHGVLGGERKIHLVNWDLVCTPKRLGGMGVMDIKGINQALLTKWVWQWSKSEDKLWKSIMKALYGQQGFGLRESFFFKGQLKCIVQFCECFITRLVGDGNTISFWNEDWGEKVMKTRFPTLYTFSWSKEISLRCVLDLLNIEELFRPITTQQTLREFASLTEIITQTRSATLNGGSDDAVWRGQVNGLFSVKSAYFVLKNGPRIKTIIHRVWKLDVSPRIKIFG